MVRIDADAIPGYAASLPRERLSLPTMDPAIHYLNHGADTLAFFLTLDSVNFGPGFFPDILADTQRSGYRCIATALTTRFNGFGPLIPRQLRYLRPWQCAAIFGLNFSNPDAKELVELFTEALNDLGAYVEESFEGDFAKLVVSAEGSAEHLVEVLAQMPLFQDVASLNGVEVPFYKRAQLAVIDLYIAFEGKGAGTFRDLDVLTACADNLVPHVLKLDGILAFEPDLDGRIERGEPIAAGSVEEVEIRAAAVHACELIVEELRRGGEQVNAMMLDNFLWHRGQEPKYRARPRHRTRTAFY